VPRPGLDAIPFPTLASQILPIHLLLSTTIAA
jgi:hypothetical protein